MAAKKKTKVPHKPPSESKADAKRPMPPWMREPSTKADKAPKKGGLNGKKPKKK